MLSDNDIDALFANIKTPYSKADIDFYIRDPGSRARETMEHIHYHNQHLCNCVLDWRNYRAGLAPKPQQSLLLCLTPGRSGPNDARASLEAISDYLSSFPHGAAPRWPILCWMSRTAFTLMDLLGDFHDTEHLRSARRHFGEFIDLASYKGNPVLMRDEFCSRLHETSESFLDECERNAVEIDIWMHGDEIASAANPPRSRYATRKAITVPQAAALTGLSESTIKRLDKDPKNTNYPGRNSTPEMLVAWGRLHRQDAFARAEVRAANRPLLGARR